MLEKHASMFSGKLGTIKVARHHIKLKPGTAPIHQAPYRAGPDKREKIRQEVEYQLKAGVIEPASSEWASPVLLAPKKDGTNRFCIDFRRLNAMTIPDTYPLPRMDDCIDSLSNARVFSLLDALWGYWQILLAEADRDKTTFTSHMGTHRYLRMPFGLRNAPATFQRILDITLSGARWRFCLVYLDDVIVFSKDYEEHLDHLDHVLGLLKEAGIKLKLKKCFFFKEEVEYLGHRIRPGTLSVYTDSKATKAVKDAQFPQTPTQMKAFLGSANVYRRFVKDFAKIASPLSDMLKKDSPVDWNNPIVPTDGQQTAFEALKASLTSPPILGLPQHDRPHMIDCDASEYAVGVVLLQQQDDDKPNEWATVGYYSKTLSKEQRNYSASERECYAVVWGVLTLRPYLEGGHFIVRTDHQALRWMMTVSDAAARLMRWRLRLMEFDYEVIYRPGRVHQVPDALSRLEQPETDDDREVDDEIPTFPRGQTDGDDPSDPVLVTTRRQAGARTRRAAAADDSAPSPAPSAPTEVPASPGRPGRSVRLSLTPTVVDGTTVKKLVRPSRASAQSRDREWQDTSHLPLPEELEVDAEDRELWDLIADAQDALVAGRQERKDDDVHERRQAADLPSPLTTEEILEEQSTDEFCQDVLRGQVGQRGTLFFEDDDGLLCRSSPKDPGVVQIVLPSTLRHRVLRLAHHHKLSGHPGQTRMFRRVARTYYWPQMTADCATTVRECVQCSKNRIRLLKQANHMRLFPATTPLESVAIDILGPLPKSVDGHLFLLVIVDRFTKLTQAIPLKSIRAYDVAVAFVNEWVFKYGSPQTLLSDNGSQFVSEFFMKVCEVLSVENTFTSTYHPQTNGQAERFNRSLTAMLRCYVEDHPTDWCRYVRALCYAYNTAVHRSTGTTPFELVLSRPPPEFGLRHSPGRRLSRKQRKDLADRLEVSIGKAKASLAKTQARYKADFDKRVRRSRKIKVDEAVYLDISDGMKRDKLAFQVSGPFRVLEVVKEGNTVVIQRGDVVERVSMNRITRAPSSDPPVDPDHATAPTDLAEKETEGTVYRFRKILDHRERSDGTLEFRIDWVGNYEPSWEPRSYIAEEAVSRYLAKVARRNRRAFRD